MPEYVIRLANSHDIDFIYRTWLDSYRIDSYLGKTTSKSIFFTEYRSIIDAILDDPATNVYVAVHPEDENVIFGYMVYGDPNVVHYCFVKEAFRRFGIACALLNHAGPRTDKPLIITHRTHTFLKLETVQNKVTFNPFLLYRRGGNV